MTRQDKIIFYLGSYTTWYIDCFPNNINYNLLCDIICKTRWIISNYPVQVSRYTRISEQPISAAVFTWPLSCHGVLTKLFSNWEDHTGQTRQGTCTAQTQTFLSLWYKLFPITTSIIIYHYFHNILSTAAFSPWEKSGKGRGRLYTGYSHDHFSFAKIPFVPWESEEGDITW